MRNQRRYGGEDPSRGHGGAYGGSAFLVHRGRGGEVYLGDGTTSPSFPLAPNAPQAKLAGNADAFVVKLAPVPRP